MSLRVSINGTPAFLFCLPYWHFCMFLVFNLRGYCRHCCCEVREVIRTLCLSCLNLAINLVFTLGELGFVSLI